MNYLETFFSKMVDSTGRTSRNDFWMTILWMMVFNMAFGIVVYLIGTIVKLPSLLAVVMSVLNVIIFLSTISMQIRRLHDTNKSAWYLLVNVIPVVGQIAVLVFYLMPGDEGTNNYGEPVTI